MLGGSGRLAESWDSLSFYFNTHLNTSLYAQVLDRCVKTKYPQEQIQTHIQNSGTWNLFKAKVAYLGAGKMA